MHDLSTTVHIYKLLFQQWQYIYETEVEVRGNCCGMENMETAVSQVWEKLPGDGTPEDYPVLTLTDPKTGKELILDEDGGMAFEGDLKNLVVKIELIALKKVETKEE